MRTDDFDYTLPTERIAQQAVEPRDASRLMVLAGDKPPRHLRFHDLPSLLRPGDILVVNDSRVIPARLFGRKSSGGQAELLLLERIDAVHWRALVGGRKMREGTTVDILDRTGQATALRATVVAAGVESLRELRFSEPIEPWLEALGHTPLPPYIHETPPDPERYQTIYARAEGSAAAPTAGLHFTGELLLRLREMGVQLEMVTLHVGLDTFKPVAAENVVDHIIHSEWARLTPDAALRINEAKLAGGRLVAVGTTSLRTLETAALRSAGILGMYQDISRRDAAGETSNICPWKPVAAFEGRTDLFITPGYRFRAVDALITNFHLPRSSLLMLVAAFAGRERILSAYRLAVEEEYRFFSFGDAMWIEPGVNE